MEDLIQYGLTTYHYEKVNNEHDLKPLLMRNSK